MAANRKIFEDVLDNARREAAPKGGLIDSGRTGSRRAVSIWLGILFALVVAMIAVGGLTRLTDSGLSITEWRPVTGALPPMNEADWQAEFEKYQRIPEYQLQNRHMTVEDFKFIYWWEWGHRQLGRFIGLVWAVGIAGLWLTRKIPAGWTGRLLGLGALGGLQGAIGWWMVSSGLSGRMVDVASYRLATHLGIAFVILGLIAWYMMDLARSEPELLQARRSRDRRAVALGTGLMHLAFVQILLGALVAGIDAGRAFPTWPLMGDSFFPADAFYLPEGGPAVLAFFENPGLVQFVHRMVGYALFFLAVFAWFRTRRSPHAATRGAFALAAVLVVVQVILGIVTVVHAAPLSLGLIHQLGAVAVWVAILRARHRATYPFGSAIRGGAA